MTGEYGPPRALELILRRILPRYAGETAVGDFEEEYNSRASERGKKHADVWYGLMILKSLPYFVGDSIRWGAVMAKNYLTITGRDIKNNPVFSFINIFGLAVGMACCIVIMLFVRQELSYDKFHKNAFRIYRMIDRAMIFGKETRSPAVRSLVGPALKEEFPEVEAFARFVIRRRFVVEYAGNRLTTDVIYADPQLFTIFTFPLVYGDRTTIFNNPESVVISENMAKKIFGPENPLSKILTIYSLDKKSDLQVTGVMKDMPANSHIRFDFLVPYRYLENQARAKKIDLSRQSCATYLLMSADSSPALLEKKFPDFLRRHFDDKFVASHIYSLQPLIEIHLNSNVAIEFARSSKISLSYALSTVALIILLIASINFISLSTARGAHRSREVGLRKVIGASRFQIFKQFLGESLFLAFLSLFIAVALAALLLTFFNSLMGQDLRLDLRGDFTLYGLLILLTVIVGLLSGSYPALFLSSYRPAETLKGETKIGSRSGVFLRKGLVIFQFSVSLVLMIGTLVISQQMRFVKKSDLGFDKKYVLTIPFIYMDREFAKKTELIQRELSQHPNIKQVVVTDGAPGLSNGDPIPCVPAGFPEDKPVELNVIPIGANYFKFFGVPVIQGRDFSADLATDAESSVMINETAAKVLGWKEPIGKQLKGEAVENSFGHRGPLTIIGMIKDIHNGTLHDEIKPTLYRLLADSNGGIYVRIRPENVPTTLAFLERKWRELPTHLPFEYSFIDDVLDRYYYDQDYKAGKIFTFSAILAVILACLGIFGLALFTAERRKKEIAIRKAIGATESNIVWLLSKNFSRLVLLSNVIAWPVGYYIGRRWLDNFAYHIRIGWWIFILASGLLLLIALLTISYQSIKAAISNPAEVLRHE
jgi:putative ABC transport system permease protein